MPLRRPCDREGCGRLVRMHGYRYCTPVCGQLADEWFYLQHQPALDTDAGTDAWVALAAAADAWSVYLDARRRLRAITQEKARDQRK
ncbi:hypothetical protein LT350_14385 [Mycolicibacterium smegmatis]|uniref:hypothetical protein n=1 Tax=Mycolicibacterium smegmatis TaxID=1772 RepID=UPI001E4D94DC|nr:hypothetical protein [Mycolicibacterium smegmatis]UGU34013.1 hypothetical protein LT350_14385 [Mycolicibacterium smegmatis]